MTAVDIRAEFHRARRDGAHLKAAQSWLIRHRQFPLIVSVFSVERMTVLAPSAGMPNAVTKDRFLDLVRVHAMAEGAFAICASFEAWMAKLPIIPGESDAAAFARARRAKPRPAADPERTEAIAIQYAWRDPDDSIHVTGSINAIERNAVGRPFAFPHIAGGPDVEADDPASLARRVLPVRAIGADERKTASAALDIMTAALGIDLQIREPRGPTFH